MGRGGINPSGNASIPNSPRGKQQKSGFNMAFTQFPTPHALELKQLQDLGSLPASTTSLMKASTGFRSTETRVLSGYSPAPSLSMGRARTRGFKCHCLPPRGDDRSCSIYLLCGHTFCPRVGQPHAHPLGWHQAFWAAPRPAGSHSTLGIYRKSQGSDLGSPSPSLYLCSAQPDKTMAPWCPASSCSGDSGHSTMLIPSPAPEMILGAPASPIPSPAPNQGCWGRSGRAEPCGAALKSSISASCKVQLWSPGCHSPVAGLAATSGTRPGSYFPAPRNLHRGAFVCSH